MSRMRGRGRQFGAFEPVLRGRRRRPGPYLTLLNLGDGREDAARAVARCVRPSRDPLAEIARLYRHEMGWRPQLVACVATLLAEPGQRPFDALLDATKDYSWISPQLLVTASLVAPAAWHDDLADDVFARDDRKAVGALDYLADPGGAEPPEGEAEDRYGGLIARAWRESILETMESIGSPFER